MTKNSKEIQHSEQEALVKATRLALKVALECSNSLSLMLSCDSTTLDADEEWKSSCETLFHVVVHCKNFAEKYLNDAYSVKFGDDANDVESD